MRRSNWNLSTGFPGGCGWVPNNWAGGSHPMTCALPPFGPFHFQSRLISHLDCRSFPFFGFCWAPFLLIFGYSVVVGLPAFCPVGWAFLLLFVHSFFRLFRVVLVSGVIFLCAFVSFFSFWDSAQGPRLRVGLSPKVVGIATPDPVHP